MAKSRKSSGQLRMRQILILAVVVLVGGGYAARFADRVVEEHPLQQASLQPMAAPEQSLGSASIA